jgi:hypothetical protein
VATTKDVRDCYLGQIVEQPDGSYYFGDTAELGKQFDQWLTRVMADAWDDGFVAGVHETDLSGRLTNPYREQPI